MDNKTRIKKLRKIIAMVADNEWDFFEFVDDHFAGDMVDGISDNWFEFVSTNEMVLQAVLLNPNFLKAYFGEELVCPKCKTESPGIGLPAYKLSPKYCAVCAAPLSEFLLAYVYHAYKILDLILEGNNPLVYFDD